MSLFLLNKKIAHFLQRVKVGKIKCGAINLLTIFKKKKNAVHSGLVVSIYSNSTNYFTHVRVFKWQ